MIDIVFPKDNENEFIKIAERLGLEGLCFVYNRPTQIKATSKKIKLFTVVLCDEKTINKYRKKHLTIMRSPDDQSRIRIILEQSRPDILFGIESSNRKDFIHHRASGLNQVHAALAKNNNIMIGFNFSDILKAKPRIRAQMMGRISQNISFARKYKFPVCLASFADTPNHLRASQDLSSFYQNLGMHAAEANVALSSVFKRLEINKN